MSSCPDCIFEIHQLWKSGFSRVYSNCYCSCSFEREIIRIGQSSHKIYSYKILNFQESMTILNVCTKKSGNLLKAPHIYVFDHLLLFYWKSRLGFFFLTLWLQLKTLPKSPESKQSSLNLAEGFNDELLFFLIFISY